MDTLDGIRAFVATAQTGSFTAAADQLGISNRLTSKYVGALEARLGTRLFQRTTRKVGLTPAGEELLARVPALLDEFDDVLTCVSEGAQGHVGTIRISAPVTFGEIYLADMLGRFAALHPNLNLDMRLSDAHADLAAEGIDLAFRIGETRTLSVKTRKLCTMQIVAAAAPDLLARHGMPQHPEDLAKLPCIIDTNLRDQLVWRFSRNGEAYHVKVEGRMKVNSAPAARALGLAGHGVVYSLAPVLAQDLAEGRLVPVLEGYTGHPVPVSAVYLEGRVLPRKVRDLIDFAQADMRNATFLAGPK